MTTSRRAMLGATAAALAGGAAVNLTAILATKASETDPIKDAADALRRMIQARHGGNWRVIVDHDTKVFLVIPRIEDARS